MRAISLAIRILQGLRRDPRTVALMIVVPIVVLTLLSVIFSGSDYKPKIAVVNLPYELIENLEKEGAAVFQMSDYEADLAIKTSEIDGILTIRNNQLEIDVEGSDPSKNNAVLLLTQKMMLPTQITNPTISYTYGYKNMSSMDNFGPIFIGLFVFFFVF